MEEGGYLEGEAALGSTLFGTTDQRKIALERAQLIGQLGSSVMIPSSNGDIKKNSAIIVAPGAEGGVPVNTGEVNVRDVFIGVVGTLLLLMVGPVPTFKLNSQFGLV